MPRFGETHTRRMPPTAGDTSDLRAAVERLQGGMKDVYDEVEKLRTEVKQLRATLDQHRDIVDG